MTTTTKLSDWYVKRDDLHIELWQVRAGRTIHRVLPHANGMALVAQLRELADEIERWENDT